MATRDGYRRILYTSVPAGNDFAADRLNIIEQSQRSNGLDGITGVLWSAPDLYVQVLEGPPHAVADTYERITRDLRHHSLAVLSDEVAPDRMFGAWSMTGLWGMSMTTTTDRLRDMVLESSSASAGMVAGRLAA